MPMFDERSDLMREVATYYGEKLSAHGTTPQGVDWKDEAGQVLRFEQLARILPVHRSPFSLNDIGCGYGALFEFLAQRHPEFTYAGLDVSSDMVAAASARHGHDARARFVLGARPDAPADFGVASGIFNVRLGRDPAEWRTYVESTLDVLDATSRRGFAFNCLTSYSDPERMRADLFYADPCGLFDRCKRRYSRDVALLHDYGLYEFTILVRKTT
jgi:SAM-dependent methyltransferase